MTTWGKEAMQQGQIEGRTVKGKASNGLEFVGYLDDYGNITNFYPVLD